MLLVLTCPDRASASEPSASNSPERRLVVLNVPGGGTDRLVEQLRTLEATELKRQNWFVEQLRRHDLEPRGIMSNREGLRTFMKRSEVDFLLYLRPAEKGYTAKLLSAPGADETASLEVDRGEGGLTDTQAEHILDEIEPTIAPPDDGRKEAASEPSESAEPEAATTARDSEEAEQRPDGKSPAAGTTGGETSTPSPVRLWTSLRGRLFHRSFSATGGNNAVLRYNSGSYPGFEVDLAAFPFGAIDEQFAPFGLFVGYNHGFESLTVENDDGNRRDVALTHLEIEGGLMARAGGTLDTSPSDTRSRFRLEATTRHARFTVDSNETLPSISTTAIALGGLLTEPILVDNLAAQAHLELIPIVFFGQGGPLFGESSYTNGFSTRLGLAYALPHDLRALAGYRFRLYHSRFSGPGASAFSNSEVFELVQGIDLGIQYAY